jgi:hypothetical protein
MGETARADAHVPSPCELCGAPCEVESDGDKPRLKCPACNHVFDVALVQASIGKWTVVDPDGVVRRFTSWQELIGSLPNASSFGVSEGTGARSTRPSSAAALLDVTPPPTSVLPGAPRLSLVPGDDPPPLPREARPRSEPPPPKVEAIEDLADEEVVPASDGVRLPPVRSIPPPLPRGASLPPPLPASAVARRADPSEPPPPPALPAPPPAPKGGTLRTLPPPPRRDLPAPPPPTINVVESKPPPPTTHAKAAEKGAEKRAEKPSTPPVARASSAPPRAPASARVPAKQARADAEPAGSRWFLPFVAIGILALGIAYMRRSPSAPESETSGGSTNGASPSSSAQGTNASPIPTTTASTTAVNGPTPLASSASSSALSSSSPSSSMGAGAGDPKPPATGSVSERVAVGDSQLALPDVLERAAAARRSNDPVHAKALLERALVLSPGNAEAYGLLGDLAHSQGDSAGAKAAYEKALGTSPSYYPALLGLADTEWDLGERDAAQRHYIAIVGLGRAAPDRVKERALGGGSSAAPASTAPSSSSGSPSELTMPAPAPAAPPGAGADVSPEAPAVKP